LPAANDWIVVTAPPFAVGVGGMIETGGRLELMKVQASGRMRLVWNI
jgi:hypothetical protein